jgi:hypothetical protein
MSHGGLDPDTPIPGSVGDRTVRDFWSWGYSNVLTNNLRGVFAEFLVGTALGTVEGTRTEWDAFDLLYEGLGLEGGAKIEVKSSSYLQSWHQEKPSAISWSVGEHYALDPATNDWPRKKTHSRLLRFLRLHGKRRPEPFKGARPDQLDVLRRAHEGHQRGTGKPEDGCLEPHREPDRSSPLFASQETRGRSPRSRVTECGVRRTLPS